MSSIFGLVPILAVVAIQLLFIRSVSSMNLTNAYLHHKCNNTEGRYKPGSVFEKNFDMILHTVVYNGNLTDGYRTYQKGKDPNIAFIKFQCRGDSYGSKCRSCLTTAVSEIDYENDFYMSNANNVSGNPELFNREISDLLKKLTIKATNENIVEGSKGLFYGAGETTIGTKKIYAMVQCTQDLVYNSCYACLEWIFRKLPECCDGKRGGRVLGTSCNFRYEFYPFLRY
ncbi:putative cysteine-rich repeat secretory protein 28 [Eutrema salsugineum]|uniref:putative cysteine-rich repeat secretory protein 28 n=1 Tax=Eutrema salsugineum TaxID=72664 RepID=UPI000CED6C51|nr:putative cysteine-rich repeat secretory protein 28 [Eutrema salsugineum]